MLLKDEWPKRKDDKMTNELPHGDWPKPPSPPTPPPKRKIREDVSIGSINSSIDNTSTWLSIIKIGTLAAILGLSIVLGMWLSRIYYILVDIHSLLSM